MKTIFPAWLPVGLAILTMLASCGGLDDRDAVVFIENSGAPVFPFALTIDMGQDGVAGAWCPSADTVTEHGRCGDGLAFDAIPANSRFTVRAPGFRTARLDFATVRSGSSDVVIYVEPAPAATSNDDYATGFGASGLDTFKAMAGSITAESGLLRAVKFYIDDIAGSPVIYFQNTVKHPLHYNFVRSVLGRTITQKDYEATTYHGEDRTGMAGTIVWYEGFDAGNDRTGPINGPFTVEFFPSDDLSPDLALRAYDVVHEAMHFLMPGGTEMRLAYLPPTAGHLAALEGSDSLFERNGATWLSRENLFGNITMQLMNRGVAYGRLLRLTPEELAAAVVSWKDIVLLTRLPIEAPLVGGFITEEMQTPLAHVNVAAMNRKTPNMALAGASGDPRVAPFIYPGTGGDGSGIVRYEVTRDGFTVEWTTQAEAEAFWEDTRPDDLVVPPADTTTAGIPLFSELGFDDSTMVGAKAANLAECRRILGDTVPDGFAVPFHWYQQFVDQAAVPPSLCQDAFADCLSEGRAQTACSDVRTECATLADTTLAAYLDGMLGLETFQQDSVFREAALDGIRYLFGHIPVDSDFANLLDDKVSAVFGTTGIRLRSSTNAEDLEEFSGAGLYESLGANTGGKVPSERIRKVWASVWNWRAFEERSYMGLRHTDVKMGVAVHRAFPAELANGVLITRNLMDPAVDGFYVNVQVGETSVTNPEDGSLPEVFVASPAGSELMTIRSRWSSLSEGVAIMTDQEVIDLYVAARKLHDEFLVLYGADPSKFALDIEFKLDSPDRKLAIKQARPYSWAP